MMQRAGLAVLAVLAALALGGNALRWGDLAVHEQHLYTFEHFVSEFRREYAPEEEAARRAVVQRNLATIVAHNRQQPAPSYLMGVNRFTDLTREEFKARATGYSKKAAQAHRRHNKRPTVQLKKVPLDDLPLAVDWRSKGIISDIKDQGNCGSCWAFGSTETIESYAAMTTSPPTLLTLSPQQLVECAPNPNKCGGVGGCQGSIPELAFEYVRDNGMTTEWIQPYLAHSGAICNPTCPCTYRNATAAVTLEGYVKLPENDYDSVMNALANVGPLAVNVEADVWQHYSTGIFPLSGCPSNNTDIDHVVQLVGYGSENLMNYWIIRNSWGPLWGERGYIRLQRDYPNPCGTDKSPDDGTGCVDGPNPAPPSVTVCGTCGVTYDVSYPTGVRIVMN